MITPVLAAAERLAGPPPIAWTTLLCVLIALAAGALISIIAAIARHHWRATGIDCIFGCGALVALWIAWVSAMGHSEPNWAFGFQSGWIGLLAASGLTLVLTREPAASPIRPLLWVAGVVLAIAIPRLIEQRESTIFLFAALLTSLFWLGDTIAARSSRP